MKLILIFLVTIFSRLNCQSIFEEDYENIFSQRSERNLPGKLGQFPYQALVMAGLTGVSGCSGSFVRFNWILTAAQCVKDSSNVKIYGGLINKLGPYSFSIEVTNKAHIIAHTSYDPLTHVNDIGLIYMEKAPKSLFTNFHGIGSVNLPTPTDELIEMGLKIGTLTGFESLSSAKGPILRYAFLLFRNDKKCAEIYGSKDIICAITPIRFASTEYFGGPIVVKRKGTKTIVGISLFKNSPAFTRVSSFLPWINANFNLFP